MSTATCCSLHIRPPNFRLQYHVSVKPANKMVYYFRTLVKIELKPRTPDRLVSFYAVGQPSCQSDGLIYPVDPADQSRTSLLATVAVQYLPLPFSTCFSAKHGTTTPDTGVGLVTTTGTNADHPRLMDRSSNSEPIHEAPTQRSIHYYLEGLTHGLIQRLL
jgi:hypothetical protein